MGRQVKVAAISKSYSAFLHQLTYKSHILECVGDSYRIRQRMHQEEAIPTSNQVPTCIIGGLPLCFEMHVLYSIAAPHEMPIRSRYDAHQRSSEHHSV
jgi:hypothetical protein